MHVSRLSTRPAKVVSHPSTDRASCCFASPILRETSLPTRYAVGRERSLLSQALTERSLLLLLSMFQWNRASTFGVPMEPSFYFRCSNGTELLLSVFQWNRASTFGVPMEPSFYFRCSNGTELLPIGPRLFAKSFIFSISNR